MGWTMLYLFVVLKIPIAALAYIVWWAIKQEPDPDEDVRDDGGTKKRPHPVPARPSAPAPRTRTASPSRPRRRACAPSRRAARSSRASASSAMITTTITSTPRMLVADDGLPLIAPELRLRLVARVTPLGRLAHPVVVVGHRDSIPCDTCGRG